MSKKLSNEEIARKYADKIISIACSMYNPAATRIAYEACLYGLTKAEKQQLIKAKENERLEKENERLEKENESLENVKNIYIGDLLKAKEIIRDFLSVAIDYIGKEDKNYAFIVEAEQFISEVEK